MAPQFLELQVQIPAYDPRDKKPVRLESHYQGGMPPRNPLLTLPTQKLTLSEDLLDFRVVPQLCTAKRITVLRNTSTTAAFEFVVDESSCNLCVDGLLSVRPLFGKIEPQESIVLEFSFAAYSQSMAFNERIKLMVRELIKGAGKQKSAAREALLKKIANKKVCAQILRLSLLFFRICPHCYTLHICTKLCDHLLIYTVFSCAYLQSAAVDHDSVVARPTFCRTVQIDNLPLAEGLHATLPSTINAKGAVVSKVVHPAFRGSKGDENAGIAGPSAGGDMTGSFVPGEFGEMSSPSLHSRGRPQSRIVEIDVPGQKGNRTPGAGLATPSGVAGDRGFNRSQFSAAGELRGGKHPALHSTFHTVRSVFWPDIF
jgi:hypothetical protein